MRGYISGEFPNALLYHILGIKGSEHSLNFPFLRPTHTLCGDNISSLLIHVIKIQALFYNDLCRRNISPLLIHAVKILALFYNDLCRRNIVGRFITKKRKEQNLTQEQLAERLGISNKTISKWETGKCMPDYAVVKNLCEELNVSVSELMDGEETDDKSIRMYDEEQILDLLRRTQELEKQKVMLTGVILIVMGIALQALSHTLGGSDVKDFFSGLLLGLSVAEMLAGIAVICKSAKRK